MPRRCSYCGSPEHTIRHCRKHKEVGKMSGSKKQHSPAWDRCVEDVRKKGSAVSPEAVCTASLKELSYRGKNPLPALRKVLKPYYIVTATKSGRATYLDRGNKFSSRPAAARRFPDSKSAVARGRAMLHIHPHLKSYRIDVRVGF
jgi:hypothetical protein